jgi:hypothetical protein
VLGLGWCVLRVGKNNYSRLILICHKICHKSCNRKYKSDWLFLPWNNMIHAHTCDKSYIFLLTSTTHVWAIILRDCFHTSAYSDRYMSRTLVKEIDIVIVKTKHCKLCTILSSGSLRRLSSRSRLHSIRIDSYYVLH